MLVFDYCRDMENMIETVAAQLIAQGETKEQMMRLVAKHVLDLGLPVEASKQLGVELCERLTAAAQRL